MIEIVPILLVAASRFLLMPKGFIDPDEINLVAGVLEFNVCKHQPHPPGTIGLIAMGKLLYPLTSDPLLALQLSVASLSVCGHVALVRLLRGWLTPGLAVSAALLFAFLPGVWLFSASALTTPAAVSLGIIAAVLLLCSRSPAVMFSGWLVLGFAVTVRPQLALVLMIIGIAALWRWRKKWRLAVLGGASSVTLVIVAAAAVLWLSDPEEYIKSYRIYQAWVVELHNRTIWNEAWMSKNFTWDRHVIPAGLGGVVATITWVGFFIVGIRSWMSTHRWSAIFILLLTVVTTIVLVTLHLPNHGRYYSPIFVIMLPAVIQGLLTTTRSYAIVITLCLTLASIVFTFPTVWQLHTKQDAWSNASHTITQIASANGGNIFVSDGWMKRALKLNPMATELPIMVSRNKKSDLSSPPFRPVNGNKVKEKCVWYSSTINPGIPSVGDPIVFEGPNDILLLQRQRTYAEVKLNSPAIKQGIHDLEYENGVRFAWMSEEVVVDIPPGASILGLEIIDHRDNRQMLTVHSDDIGMTNSFSLNKGKQRLMLSLPCSNNNGCSIRLNFGKGFDPPGKDDRLLTVRLLRAWFECKR